MTVSTCFADNGDSLGLFKYSLSVFQFWNGWVRSRVCTSVLIKQSKANESHSEAKHMWPQNISVRKGLINHLIQLCSFCR